MPPSFVIEPGPSIPLLVGAVSSEDVAEILIWSAVLVGLVIVLAVVMVIARRRSAPDQNRAAPFTLGELRRLRDEGQLTDEEYQRTRDRLVGSVTPPETGQQVGPQTQGETAPDTPPPGTQPPGHTDESAGGDHTAEDDENSDSEEDQRGA